MHSMFGSFVPYLQYYHTPNVDKPIAEIYSDLDSGSMEDDESNPDIAKNLWALILVPPVFYEGRWLKGILVTRAVDYLCKQYPELSEAFVLMATSFWCSYPFSKKADVYMTLYDNPARAEWFRTNNPGRADKALLPIHDSDLFHDFLVAPTEPKQRKEHDVIVISRLSPCKNLWMIAEALKVYHHKYGKRLRCVLVVGTEFDINKSGLNDIQLAEYRKIEKVLTHVSDYITIVPKLSDYRKTVEYLAKAKIAVLGSLIEGKSRFIYEAMACNTPVVLFNDFNKYARGPEKVLPQGGGLAAPDFSAESLADTMYNTLKNIGEFSPRRSVLTVSGRRNVARMCFDQIPYYRENFPDLGVKDIFSSLWLDLAVQENYQMSPSEFIFEKNKTLAYPRADSIKETLNFFVERWRYFVGGSRPKFKDLAAAIEASSLRELFDQYGSIKGSAASSGEQKGRQYEYDEFVSRELSTILEIGVGTGLPSISSDSDETLLAGNGKCGSIFAWLSWCPKAQVYGFDLATPASELFDNPRFHFIQGDQSEQADLERLAEKLPLCDLIIDDGSHESDHQLLTLSLLWDKLKVGGYYVIEDIHLRLGKEPHTVDKLTEDPRFYRFIGNAKQGIVLKKIV